MSTADRQLMRQLAQANLAEIATAKLAQEKSSNEDVKKFAQQMIDDHTKAMDQLTQVAQQKGVDLPTEPDAKHQALMKKMQGLSGDAFDRQYSTVAGMRDHNAAHQLLARAAKRAKDPDLKALVAQMQPTITEHMTMAKGMHKEVLAARGGGAAQSTGSSGSSGDQASGKDGESSGSKDADKGGSGK